MAYSLEIQRDKGGAVIALSVVQDGQVIAQCDWPEDVDQCIRVARDMAGCNPYDSHMPEDKWIILAMTGDETAIEESI
jgi:hypothetical protein